MVQAGLVAANVKILVTAHPCVIQSGMVRDEVEHKPQSSLSQPLSESRQSLATAEIGMHHVVLDGERRTADIGILKVGQSGSVLLTPFRLCKRNRTACFSGLPHAEQPDPVETQGRNPIERCI